MLWILDIILSLLHIAIIVFNLLGWIWKRTRKWHLVSILITAASWLILGIWYGIGYCPITDWQWHIKNMSGETGLPGSFITYFAEKVTGAAISNSFINSVTAVVFIIVAFLSVYFNFFHKQTRATKN